MIEKEILKFIEYKVSSFAILPTGSIFAFASTNIPNGYLPCEGQELSTRQYPKLYSIIGNTFGGNHQVINLLVLQGQFIRGLDCKGNVDCEYEDIRALGSIQENSYQGHGHKAEGKRTVTEDLGDHQYDLYKEEHVGSFATIFYSVNHDGFAHSSSCKKGKVKISSAGCHKHSYTHRIEVGEPVNSIYGISRVAAETRSTNMALIICINAN